MRRRDCALIFLLTAYLILPVFRNEYLAYWGSIQATFIADARYLNENWPHPQWQPNWYMGTRWDYIYPPALRYGTAAIARYGGVSEARGYLIYIGVMYCVGIVGVYVFVAAVSRSRWMAWLATLVVATASPTYPLFVNIANDNAMKHYWPMRWNVLIRYGEGPHMSSFALIPLVLAAAWFGVRRGHTRYLGLAALGAALVVSNNFYGATALATFFPVLVWAIFLEDRDWRVWLRAAAIAALACGLTAFWLTPSYLRVTLDNMRLVSQPGNTWSVWVAMAVVLALGVATWKWMRDAWAIFVVGSAVLFTVNVVGNHLYDFRVMGEPGRLIPELDLCIILATVTACAWLWKRRLWHKTVVVALVCLWIYTSNGWVRRAHELIDIDNNFQARLEYRITDWIAANMGGKRVLANGTVRFWYNAWHQMPQVGGGSEQGTLNINSTNVYYAAAMKSQLSYAVAWLQAVGASAIGVHDKTSEEIYHDIEEPQRYAPLKALYADGKGNWIYEVPRRFPDLARVVEMDKIRAHGPLNGGKNPVEAYAAIIEQGPDRRAALTRQGPEVIRVEATLDTGHGVLVQETFDPAWHAYENGRELRIEKDPADFMLLDPGPGAHQIELRFETPLENRVGRTVTIGSILVLIWLLAPSRRSRPAASLPSTSR